MSTAIPVNNDGDDCFEDPSLDGTRRRLFPDSLGGSKLSDSNETNNDPATIDHDGMEYHESSPTAIYEFPSQGFNKKRRLAPQITCGEDGAEVSIDLSSLNINQIETPDDGRRRSLEDYKQGSLLDADSTPTPPSVSKYDIANLCCSSISNAIHDEDYSVGASRAEIERTISTFLDDSGSVNNINAVSGCSAWQAWPFMLENEANNNLEDPSNETIKSNLRNRAFDQGAKKLRVRQLRKDLNPFTNSPKKSPAPELVKSRSFAIEEHRNGIARVSKDKRAPRNSFTNVLNLCTMPENSTVESPLAIRHPAFEEREKADICYDSDPEDFTKRGHNRISSSSSTGKENHKKNQLYKYSYSQPINPSSPPGHNEEDQVVQELFNGKSTLIYHPTSTSQKGDVQPLTPVAVDAWLERGQRLTQIIQPKWMWKLKPRARNSGPASTNESHHVISIKGIELLDITRILKIQNVNRTYYPFAKPNKSFLIRTIDNEELFFEAQSTNERDRLVYSLKVAVAKFGAKVVMGDFNVYNEFFATTAGAVPGEAPDLNPFGGVESMEEEPPQELLL